MFERLANSWQLVKASARVLQADKELLVFPAVSGLTVLLVSASFFVPLAFLGVGFDTLGEGSSPVAYAGLFIFYFIQYCVIFFFNTALVGAALIRIDGGDPTIGDGLRIARKHLGSIFGYAAIAATVGLVLRAASERSGLLGQIVIGIIGMSWSLATFLVVPVLVTRNLGPIEAIKESGAILKRTWGEQIAGNLAVGAVFTLIFIGWTILLIPAAIVGFMASMWLGILVLAFFFMGYVIIGLVNAALSGIYAAAVYRFATTGQASLFDQRLLEGAFRQT